MILRMLPVVGVQEIELVLDKSKNCTGTISRKIINSGQKRGHDAS